MTFIVVCTVVVLWGTARVPVTAQDATPLPLVQTLNARMAGALDPDATPIPDGEPEDEIAALLADIPQGRGEDGAFILGDPDAPITLIVFEDFACPHCQDYHETIVAFIRDHVATGEARLESRIFPTAGGQLSAAVAQVLECAERQQEGTYWTAYMALYELASARNYEQTPIIGVFEDLGIDIEAMIACAQEVDRVIVDVEYGQALGVRGTPAVMVRIGNDDATYITVDDVTYDRGAAPLEVLAAAVAAANA
jgi:protein-disulfide isomerase